MLWTGWDILSKISSCGFEPRVSGNLKEQKQTILTPGHNQTIGSEKLSNWFLYLFSVKGGEVAEADLSPNSYTSMLTYLQKS